MPEIAPDTVIDGRYRVDGRIGTGGMADVFVAHDQQLGRPVALKLLHRQFAEDPAFVERFRREASAAAGLSHPNIVGVYDRGEWDGTYYIAMEYLPGRSLKQIIREQAPLDPDWAIDITEQILRAARFAHRRGVIHRDIKPHNVIVDDDGRAKVTDFGIARAGTSDVTETGSIMGTAQYLSPEQAQGHAVSAGSDLYAVGIVLYEMLTGRVPFESETAVSVALAHVSEAPQPPSAHNPAIWPALDEVVLGALEKDPARRFGDADAFVEALEDARGVTGYNGPVSPIPPEPPAPPEQPPERRRRRWPWIAGAIVALLVALVIIIVVLVSPGQQAGVPKVVGGSVAQAITQLKGQGFKVAQQRRHSPRKIGYVLAQSPQAGAQVDTGSTVTLTVSSGPGSAQVPDVAHLGRGAAVRAIHARGFQQVQVKRQPSATVAHGQVVATNPPAGSTRPVDTPITVLLSSGPKQVKVPGVVGDRATAAENELVNAGLRVDAQPAQSSEGAPGTVISQSPSAGDVVDPKTTVQITIAQQPPTQTQTQPRVSVPGVGGESENKALRDLAAAGLKGRSHQQTVSDPSQDGVVLRQSPRGGAKVDPGAKVNIIVGRYRSKHGGGTPTTPTTPGGTPITP